MKPILEVHHLSKKFRIRHQSANYLSFRERLVESLRFRTNNIEDFWALSDVNFQVEAGESLAIIGKNGAGKSTILRILSRITPPTKGRIVSRGRIASLLEVGTGFHQELTGRENIFLNGSLLGMKSKEIRAKFDEIVDFSGTVRFLDTQLKHYSSGMQLRLAFSVAAFLEPEIMIIDEVLAVGDAEFQRKCMGKMGEVKRSGRTILFVSHDLNAVSNLCTKALVLKEGQVNFAGDVLSSISHYQRDNARSEIFQAQQTAKGKRAYFQSIRVCTEKGETGSGFLYQQPIRVEFEIGINDPQLRCDVFMMVLDARKRRIFALETNELKERLTAVIDPGVLVRGDYSICAYINQPNVARIDEADDVCHFQVIDNGSPMLKHGDYDYGSVFGKGKWI